MIQVVLTLMQMRLLHLSIYRDSSRTQLLDSSNFIINDTSTASNFQFLLVGGGGAGGRMSSSTTNYTSFSAAGGGGAGGVRVVSDSDVFDNHSNYLDRNWCWWTIISKWSYLLI